MPVETLTCKKCGSHDIKIKFGIAKCANCGSTNIKKNPEFPFIA